ELYSRALDNTLSDTLRFYLESLVERTLDAGPESPDVALGDPRFERPGSGWYWVIRSSEGEVLNLSDSLAGSVLPEIEGLYDDNNSKTGVRQDQFGTRLRMVEQQVTANGVLLRITVTGSLDEILSFVAEFRGQTLIVLSAVGVMLAVMSAIVARIAMRPIGLLGKAIEQVREGESETVKGNFPREIAPLADEVNELLRSNAQIVERARNQVGNLAHGLKTPLAVMRNEASADKSPLAKVVLAESDKMAFIVSSYLDRARLATRTAVVGKKTDPTLVMLRLARVMEKLNRDKCTITFERPDASLPWFRGDESDLEEMAGNLLENACKWSKSQVGISMVTDRTSGEPQLLIRIEDDGPGLTPEEATKVLKRGVRLDEKTPGSGLGLDIVKELVDVYGGGLELKRSKLGGLLAELRLPVAKLGGLAARR
ncbi:MAG TPA: HAMP domain-containing sensor histidine kinase, partial [Sphingomicrobium sp.]|nr:HAMP domain-containing sensor histidine kinase [Sphingomicrobium sp.]